MHRRWLLLIAAPTLALGAMRGSAQTQPNEATTMPATRGDDGPDGHDGPFRGGGPRGGGGPFGERGGFDRGDRGPGRGGPGGPGGGMERRAPSMDVMRGFLELVDRYTQLSSNPDAAGVSAVLATNDLYRGKPDEAIAYFTKLLDEVRRPTVKRAIRLQLIDLYKAAGKTELAIEQLEILMKAPVNE